MDDEWRIWNEHNSKCFDGSTGYYLYDPRGSVTGLTNEEGQIYQSYRYSVFGEITFGAPRYENEYTYNGESYNPNIKSQYLRARYYCVVTADFLTEDSYLGRITEPLTLNRYNYCLGNPMNYADPSGHMTPLGNLIMEWLQDILAWPNGDNDPKPIEVVGIPIPPTPTPEPTQMPNDGVQNGNGVSSFPNGYLNQQIDDAQEKGYDSECENITLQEIIKTIDGYLEGNVSEEYAQSCIKELAERGALYENKYINSVKEYKSDFKNRDYDQFDAQIIGWVAYYNYKFPDFNLNPEWVKAMLYVESVYSYSASKSPNANASIDIMQTLDPRNSTIYDYVYVDIVNTYVAGPGYKDVTRPDYRVTVEEIRKMNNMDPILQQSVDGDIIPLAQTLFSEENGKYYYEYSNATQFMSLAIGIYTLQKKYRLLDSSTEYCIPDKILEKYNIGDPRYTEKINYLLNLDIHQGWEDEYENKFKK